MSKFSLTTKYVMCDNCGYQSEVSGGFRPAHIVLDSINYYLDWCTDCVDEFLVKIKHVELENVEG